MTIFIVCISVVITQRIVELIIARNHTEKLSKIGAIEYDRNGYRVIVIMHICFFISLFTEYIIFRNRLNTFWYIFAVIILFGQVLRYWAIRSLGVNWTTRIIAVKGGRLIKSGPYKYFKHPNYSAVVIEIALLPLVFSCYFTSIVFTVLNFFILRRRIRIETNTLNNNII